MKPPRLERVAGGWTLRLRYGQGQRGRFLLPLDSRAAAEKRARHLVALATLLASADRHVEALVILRKGAAQTTDAGFAEVEQVARELCAEAKARSAFTAAPLTFRQLGEQWTSGKLARDYPDHVKVKRSVAADEYRLTALYRTIGSVALKDFTLADAKRAMAAIPSGRTPGTRRHYAQLIARLLKMAVFPCELIERYPLPPGFLPKTGQRPALSYLYPVEDQRLLACTLVPFELRLLYGFLAREGLRLGEALALCWRHMNLKHGTIRLEHTKTGDTRAWALDPDTAKTMTAVRESRAAESENALVFPNPGDRPVEIFRAYLLTAGVHRAELFERTAHRRPIRLHDQRACFCTLALAGGRSETWVMDRTGHATSQMLNKYRRQSRNAAELGLGWLAPLDAALPELATVTGPNRCSPAQEVGHRVGQTSGAPNLPDAKTSSIPDTFLVGHEGLEPSTNGLRSRHEDARGDETAGKPPVGDAPTDANEHAGHPSEAKVGQSSDPLDAVEAALTHALTAASAAGRWAVVAQLAAELQARREARAVAPAANVVPLRPRRNGGQS